MRSGSLKLVLSAMVAVFSVASCPLLAAKPWASAKDANVLVIGLDAVRARSLSLYGHPESTTPNLDALAKKAVVFNQAITPASWTLPATMSLFTGLWPSVHGVINKYLLLGDKLVISALSPAIPTYPEILHRHGYRLAAFTGDAGVKSMFGYGRDFDVYLDDLRFGGLDHSIPPAIEWLKKHGGEKFFMFLHGYDAHGSYDPPEGYDRRFVKSYTGTMKGGKEEQGKLREEGLDVRRHGTVNDVPVLKEFSKEDAEFHHALYLEKIAKADGRLGEFLKEFEAMGLLDKTVIIVFGDHGEEFGEHGYIDHGPTLYEELLRVPFVIRFPGQKERIDVNAQVRTLDALPTALDALGIRTDHYSNGQSLLPLLEGQELELPAFAETDYRHITHRRAIRTPTHKLIMTLESGRKELYDLEKDPMEQKNVIEEQSRVAYELEQKLAAWMKATNQHPESFRERAEPFILEY